MQVCLGNIKMILLIKMFGKDIQRTIMEKKTLFFSFDVGTHLQTIANLFMVFFLLGQKIHQNFLWVLRSLRLVQLSLSLVLVLVPFHGVQGRVIEELSLTYLLSNLIHFKVTGHGYLNWKISLLDQK